MKKLTTLFLMLCLTLSGALCYASGLARTENEKGKDGTPISVRVYQLNLDCGTNENITCQSDLDNFDYKLKKSVSITSSISGTCVSSTDNVTFRVTDSFEVTGPFEVQQGGEFTVIMQECPN